MQVELDISRTEELSQWNKPRAKKMEPLPTYELPFEKQVHGKQVKEIKGKHPTYYQLDHICDSEKQAAATLIRQLKQYEVDNKTKVACLQGISEEGPVNSINVQAPIGSIIDKINTEIANCRKSGKCRNEKINDVVGVMKVTEQMRDQIELETREQSGSFLWSRAREKRITASLCHRVISFTGRTSGKLLANEIIKRKAFSTASTEFGIDHEQLAIDKYRESRNIMVDKCGLFVSIEQGYLAASPDGIITRPDGEKGLLEVKALPSWASVTVVDAYKNSKYPVRMTYVNELKQRVPKLKKNHQYYHQVQLQLYCCSHFAQFADFVLFHANTSEMHTETIYPDLEWQAEKIPKLESFYKEKVIQELLK